MRVFEHADGGALEGTLQGERIYEVELFPHHDSPATFFDLLDVEAAILEVEIGVFCAKETKRELERGVKLTRERFSLCSFCFLVRFCSRT